MEPFISPFGDKYWVIHSTFHTFTSYEDDRRYPGFQYVKGRLRLCMLEVCTTHCNATTRKQKSKTDTGKNIKIKITLT